jgi:hypothetical protein
MFVSIKDENFIPFIKVKGPIKKIEVSQRDYDRLRQLGFSIQKLQDEEKAEKQEVPKAVDETKIPEPDNNDDNDNNDYNVEEMAKVFETYNKKELKEFLTEANIEFEENSNKQTLINLLLENKVEIDLETDEETD